MQWTKSSKIFFAVPVRNFFFENNPLYGILMGILYAKLKSAPSQLRTDRIHCYKSVKITLLESFYLYYIRAHT